MVANGIDAVDVAVAERDTLLRSLSHFSLASEPETAAEVGAQRCAFCFEKKIAKMIGVWKEREATAMNALFRITTAGFVFSLIATGNRVIAQPSGAEPGKFVSPDRIYYTIGGTEKGGDSFETGGPVLANAVLTPRIKSVLVGLTLNVKLRRRDLGSFDIFVSNISPTGQFYSTRIIGNVPDSLLTKDFERITMGFSGHVPLAANKKYYVGIRKHPGAMCTVILGNTQDPTILSRPEVISSGFFYNRRSGLQQNSLGPYQMIVNME